nr:AAA family ATPase [uncultured Sellimonas sp.]
MDKRKKMLPIGIEDFPEIRTEDFYYVDKTAMIGDLLRKWGKVNLFTRPRRFGKSLNMSMLKSFFEIGCDPSLFHGLEISEMTTLCETYMGQFPVISLTLKNAAGLTYQDAYAALRREIGNEARRFDFLMTSSQLDAGDKEMYAALTRIEDGSYAMSDEMFADSLRTLTGLLARHYGRKVILLIDEYDVPLDKSFQGGYYTKMVSLIRSLLGNVLKTNPDLHFAVLIGCLRIAKESIFTGLNNMKVFSISDEDCDSYFGFTDKEVKEILAYYGLDDKYETIKDWYDGYQFGDAEVYCPWDVMNYVDRLQSRNTLLPQNYWVNTSGNDAVRYLIQKMGDGVLKSEIESLVAGDTVEKELHEDLTYQEIYASIDHVWSLLFMTGYLTQRGRADRGRIRLAIPNLEIRSIFSDQILAMFRENAGKDGELLKNFCDAIEQGDAAEVEHLFETYLQKTISVRDTFVRRPTKENFYHGILLGILGYKDGWILKSNKESGNGFSDISIRNDDQELGIIIEVKYAEKRQMEEVCREAIAQIEKNRYTEELEKEGCHTILKYGIACCRKECRVFVEKTIR